MGSINFQPKEVKKYRESLWQNFKYNTMFDLLNCTKEEMVQCKFLKGHVEAVLMISNGDHANFATQFEVE